MTTCAQAAASSRGQKIDPDRCARLGGRLLTGATPVSEGCEGASAARSPMMKPLDGGRLKIFPQVNAFYEVSRSQRPAGNNPFRARRIG
jgi:hypothetical protein